MNTNVLGHFLLFWNICIRHEKYWSGLERWTLTITKFGNGLTGQVLTFPTGGLVSLVEESTTLSWPLILESGTILLTTIPVVTFASSPFKHRVPAGIVQPPTACPNWPTIRFPILVNKITSCVPVTLKSSGDQRHCYQTIKLSKKNLGVERYLHAAVAVPKFVIGGSYHVEKWSWCLWTKEATAGQGWQFEDIQNVQVRMWKHVRIVRIWGYGNMRI